MPKAENIVFVGPTGVGKTGLASGLVLKALHNGHRGVFMRAQDLNLRPEQTNIFFKLMEERCRQRATIITANLGPTSSATRPSSAHHSAGSVTSATTVKINGPSLRDETS